jgi:hypothetical protein
MKKILNISSISTDDAISAILYGVANKVKMGLDIEETVKVAQTDILGFWSRDMREIEKDVITISENSKTTAKT